MINIDTLEGEIFKEIFHERYVSNYGRVYSAYSERLLTQQLNKDGYHVVGINTKGVTNGMFMVHRLVAKAFIVNPDNKSDVNHIDSNKSNNHASNLEWCTRLENMHHGAAAGTVKFFGNVSKAQPPVILICDFCSLPFQIKASLNKCRLAKGSKRKYCCREHLLLHRKETNFKQDI